MEHSPNKKLTQTESQQAALRKARWRGQWRPAADLDVRVLAVKN